MTHAISPHSNEHHQVPKWILRVIQVAASWWASKSRPVRTFTSGQSPSSTHYLQLAGRGPTMTRGAIFRSLNTLHRQCSETLRFLAKFYQTTSRKVLYLFLGIFNDAAETTQRRMTNNSEFRKGAIVIRCDTQPHHQAGRVRIAGPRASACVISWW
jgi:hypothetical protein